MVRDAASRACTNTNKQIYIIYVGGAACMHNSVMLWESDLAASGRRPRESTYGRINCVSLSTMGKRKRAIGSRRAVLEKNTPWLDSRDILHARASSASGALMGPQLISPAFVWPSRALCSPNWATPHSSHRSLSLYFVRAALDETHTHRAKTLLMRLSNYPLIQSAGPPISKVTS